MIDVFNRESLAIVVEHALASEHVEPVLSQKAQEHDHLGNLRPDNGRELIAVALNHWPKNHDVELAVQIQRRATTHGVRLPLAVAIRSVAGNCETEYPR